MCSLFVIVLLFCCSSSSAICIDLPSFYDVTYIWQSAKCALHNGCAPECGGFQPNNKGFRKDLKLQFYGQHIAENTVLTAVLSHWTDDSSNKALVMSFHGSTGVGKTYLADFIVKNMYGAGLKSPFAHRYHSELVFRNPNKVVSYKDDLQDWIKTNVTRCQRSIFIFDDLEFMHDEIIDVFIPYLRPRSLVDGVDYSKAIFIFISNVGAKMIARHLSFIENSGETRESITLSQLETKLRESAYKEKNGLRGSGIITKYLIDHYVPFLPLTEEHVRECISNEIDRIRSNLDSFGPQSRKNRMCVEDDVLSDLQWYSGEDNDKASVEKYLSSDISKRVSYSLYSKSGCTKVASKVAYHLNKFKS